MRLTELVDHGDAESLGLAVATILTRPRIAEAMQMRARRLASSLAWPAVARRYGEIVDQMVNAQGGRHAGPEAVQVA